jgi:hypothetical protein
MGNLGHKNKTGSGKRSSRHTRRRNTSSKSIPTVAFHSDSVEPSKAKREEYNKAWLAGSLILSHEPADYSQPPTNIAKDLENMINAASRIASGKDHDITVKAPSRHSKEWKLLIISDDENDSRESSYSSFSPEDLLTWSIKWLNIKR